MNKKELLTFNTILTFGKYKGKRIHDVYKRDSSYLSWALRKILGFRMCEVDVKTIEIMAQREHRDWLCANYNAGDAWDHWDN
jgi:uncharacterized protein (DUF3820 family)